MSNPADNHEIRIRTGWIRIFQTLALGFMLIEIAEYGGTGLTIPVYLLVIVLGEVVDRLVRILRLMSIINEKIDRL